LKGTAVNCLARFPVAHLRTLVLALPILAAIGCQEKAPVDKATEQQQLKELDEARQKEWNNK
jgi:hypothetical protein